jgi:hypothetical protein
MKHGKLLTGFMVLFCASALFLACPTDSEDDTNYGSGETQEKEIAVVTGTPKYFSFTTGAEVTDAAKIASKEWDIAFQPSRMIYTNSGATAETASSGGLGGVWFTNKTDFDDVSDEDEVETTGDYAEYADFTTDVVKYTSATASNRFNVMTYWGFASGSGTAEDPYKSKTPASNPPPADFVPYTYDKKNYVSMTAMTGPNGAEFKLSNQVYIVKHGDGTNYSKLQITSYKSVSSGGGMGAPVTETYTFKYRNF